MEGSGVLHAAVSAAIRHPELVKYSTVVLSKFPCYKCAQALIQVGASAVFAPVVPTQFHDKCEEWSEEPNPEPTINAIKNAFTVSNTALHLIQDKLAFTVCFQ